MSLANLSPVVILSHPSTAPLAKRLASVCNSNGQRRSIERKVELRVAEARDGAIQWGEFEDGFPNLFINDVKGLAGSDVIFLASFHNKEVIFEQLAILYALPRYLVRSLHVILPYFPTGTMERVDHEGQIATAYTLCTLLSTIPLSTRGPATILIFDIHALQERFYFGPQVIPRLESGIPLLLRRLRKMPEAEQKLITIAFPDDGAHKRFHSFFEMYPTIICNKVREGDLRIVKVKEGTAEGRIVIIVDDLVKTGGTLIQCAKVIRENGCKTMNAYVTHAVFPCESWKRFQDGLFETFWITDSVPTVVSILEKEKPFELLSLCDVLAESLLDYDLNLNI